MPPSQATARRFTIFLASLTALTSISIDMSLPAVPAIERAFALQPSHGALTLSFFLAGYSVTPLLGGPLADRFGRRPVLLVVLGLFTASALLCAVSPGFHSLLLARLLQGCSAGVGVSLPLAIVRDRLSGPEARQRISDVTTVNGLMPLLAPVLGGWVLLLGSWRWIFGTQAVFAVYVVLGVVFYFEESLPADRRQPFSPAGLLRNYATLLGDRRFLGYAAVYALLFGMIFSYISESPLLLMHDLGLSRTAYTMLFGVTALGTILGAFSSAWLSRSAVPVRAMLSGGLLLLVADCALAAALALAGLHKVWTIVGPMFVMLFCFGLTTPAVTLEALETVPHLAGSGSGVLRSLQMIVGSAASGFLAAWCARRGVQPESSIMLTVLVFAVAAVAIYFSALRGNTAPETGSTLRSAQGLVE